MINLGDYTNENKTEHDPKWKILDLDKQIHY